jgi:hypothetical protein
MEGRATCSLSSGVSNLLIPGVRACSVARPPLCLTNLNSSPRPPNQPSLYYFLSACLLNRLSFVAAEGRHTHTNQCRLEHLLGRLGTRCHLRRPTTAFPSARRRRYILFTVLIVSLFPFHSRYRPPVSRRDAARLANRQRAQCRIPSLPTSSPGLRGPVAMPIEMVTRSVCAHVEPPS